MVKRRIHIAKTLGPIPSVPTTRIEPEQSHFCLVWIFER